MTEKDFCKLDLKFTEIRDLVREIKRKAGTNRLELMMIDAAIDYCMELIEDFEIEEVDWSSVPVDAKVRVRNSLDEKWLPRHFSRVDKDGNLYAFLEGCTSYTVLPKGSDMVWPYMELVEE